MTPEDLKTRAGQIPEPAASPPSASTGAIVWRISLPPIVLLIGAAALWRDEPFVGALGGGAALVAIVILFGEHFRPPRRGDPIKAPDAWLRRSAGAWGVLSALLWIVDSLFNGR